MRRVVVVILLVLLLSMPLFADSSLPKAVTVRMVGTISPRDVEIIITDEAGFELGAGDGLLMFEFPALEEWEVTQTLKFSYSSHLSRQKKGNLSFDYDDFNTDGSGSLRVSLELRANDPNKNTTADDNSFTTTFLPDYRNKIPMGTLTVRIQKRPTDIYKAGPYTGVISMTYTEES